MKYEVVPTELTERAGAWADFWTVTIQVPQPPSLQDTCIIHTHIITCRYVKVCIRTCYICTVYTKYKRTIYRNVFSREGVRYKVEKEYMKKREKENMHEEEKENLHYKEKENMH